MTRPTTEPVARPMPAAPSPASGTPVEPVGLGPGRRPRLSSAQRRRRLREHLVAYGFVAPSLIGVVAFLLVPVVMVLVLSLFDWRLLSDPHFVGLDNYRRLAGDDGVRHSLVVTVLYVLLSIPVQTVLALLIALLLNQGVRGIRIFRALFVVPWMATPVVLGLVWTWVFDPKSGAINQFLGLFGIAGPSWLSSTALALPAIAAVQVWQYAGYNMLFFLAGLQSIPEVYYEAASLDGANRVRQFFTITLPLLRPTLFFVLVTNIIGSFQVFDTVFVMTNGGPQKSTETINFTIYNTAFRQFDFGYASTLAVLLFLIILVVTLGQARYFSRSTTYDLS